MKFISWNVNGLRACMKKGFEDFFAAQKPDFLCLQETKMEQGQAQPELNSYLEYWNSAEKKGYSGTAVFTPHQPLAVAYGMDKDIHDHEGRLITLEYEGFYLVCCYTPNAQDGLKRLDYRMVWEDDLREYLLSLDKHKPVIYCGDLKDAHGWFFIGGQSGAGKTHICTAICREFLLAGREVKYMLWRDDAAQLKGIANDPVERDKLLHSYKNVEILYIDDLFKTGKGDDGLIFMVPGVEFYVRDLSSVEPISVKYDGDVEAFPIFHARNKPSGTYTGNGSATSREIPIYGLGTMLLVSSDTGMALVSNRGAICKVSNSSTVEGIPSQQVRYDGNTLTIASDNNFLNKSSQTYWYQVL